MKTVSQVLKAKGSDVWSVSPDTSVFDALSLMAEKNVGALVVKDGEKVVGIFSERDYARKVILKGKHSKDLPVREIMSTHVTSVSPRQDNAEIMELMTARHIRHLPVLEGESLVGLVSIGDAVKAVISEKEFVIEQLQNYITKPR